MKECWIRGDIITNEYAKYYEYFKMDYASPRKLENEFAQAEPDEEVVVHVNSGGGIVSAGMDMYSQIATRKNVTVVIDGVAASAAGVLTQGADKVLISPVGAIMIHNVSGGSNGDYHEMEKTAEALKELNRSMANAYAIKSGRPIEEILELMDKETWLSANKAIEYGFADKITEPQKIETINATGLRLTPEMIKMVEAAESETKKKIEDLKTLLNFYG